jgi:hypothetical protein
MRLAHYISVPAPGATPPARTAAGVVTAAVGSAGSPVLARAVIAARGIRSAPELAHSEVARGNGGVPIEADLVRSSVVIVSGDDSETVQVGLAACRARIA